MESGIKFQPLTISHSKRESDNARVLNVKIVILFSKVLNRISQLERLHILGSGGKIDDSMGDTHSIESGVSSPQKPTPPSAAAKRYLLFLFSHVFTLTLTLIFILILILDLLLLFIDSFEICYAFQSVPQILKVSMHQLLQHKSNLQQSIESLSILQN
jgi:hypothetical protein